MKDRNNHQTAREIIEELDKFSYTELSALREAMLKQMWVIEAEQKKALEAA